ncbi:hypothetical protein N9514_01655 [Pseudomonadales bacterium]|jgi:hypothetical protein|nr:hypothetical protein [Pseudomonadales bacterium]MDB4068721.1 hypothetical protein [Pseudomonadales bacterium]MDB9867311.1 hypothetical protein [Pseudomonadales bacterium]MDB9917763.1 hypothetical protein [Pseudomonadales bacterium]
MTLKVIGAGFGRTGTLSLKLALEQLGLTQCHHMMELFASEAQRQFWHDAAFGKKMDWDTVFEGYQASVDWPSCAFYEELLAHYPQAKVILSLRDPDKWFDSASETIFKGLDSSFEPSNLQGQMARKLIVEDTFGGRHMDREHAKAVFTAHNDAVKRTVPANRLLVFEASMGWQPLCDFLEVPVPAQDYPRTNSTDEFKQRMQAHKKT